MADRSAGQVAGDAEMTRSGLGPTWLADPGESAPPVATVTTGAAAGRRDEHEPTVEAAGAVHGIRADPFGPQPDLGLPHRLGGLGRGERGARPAYTVPVPGLDDISAHGPHRAPPRGGDQGLAECAP